MDIENMLTLNNHEQQTKDWISIANKLYKIRQLKKDILYQEEILLKTLSALSDNKNSKGGQYVFTCIIRRGHINYSQIKELQFIDLERYRKKPVVTWKLSKI